MNENLVQDICRYLCLSADAGQRDGRALLTKTAKVFPEASEEELQAAFAAANAILEGILTEALVKITPQGNA